MQIVVTITVLTFLVLLKRINCLTNFKEKISKQTKSHFYEQNQETSNFSPSYSQSSLKYKENYPSFRILYENSNYIISQRELLNDTIAEGVYNLEVDQASQFEVNILQKGYQTIFPSITTNNSELLNIYHFSLGKILVTDYYILIFKRELSLYSIDKNNVLTNIKN